MIYWLYFISNISLIDANNCYKPAIIERFFDIINALLNFNNVIECVEL